MLAKGDFRPVKKNHSSGLEWVELPRDEYPLPLKKMEPREGYKSHHAAASRRLTELA